MPSPSPNISELIVDDLRYDFNKHDLTLMNAYSRVIIFTQPVNGFLKTIIEKEINIENGRNTKIHYYPVDNIYMKNRICEKEYRCEYLCKFI